MFERMPKKQLVYELKNLIKKIEEYDEVTSNYSPYQDNDMYCELMKEMILNTYTTN